MFQLQKFDRVEVFAHWFVLMMLPFCGYVSHIMSICAVL